MFITHQYRIKPSPDQVATMETWLELLRRHHNYSLGQRLDCLRRTRGQIDRCSLVSEPIGDIPGRFPNYNLQAGNLKQTKELFPDYKNIYHDVQQQNLKRLDRAWERWMKPDKTGFRGGRPKFKKLGEMRSFTFPRINCPKAGAQLKDSVLKLSGIGLIPVVMHRLLPDGSTLKTCTVVKQADGWYISISLEDASVPSPMPLDTVKAVVGVDVGLKVFLATSDGSTVAVQQIYRQAQGHLARQQRKLARKQKGSRNYRKQANRVARVHQRVRRQRQDFHYKTAHKLVKEYDLIAVEDLNIKGLARTNLAKSILDVAWAKFIAILEAVGVKSGVRIVKVNPYGTSQDCSGCGVKVSKDLSIRTHECPKCGLQLDRDVNAAVNILERGLKAVGLIVSACRSLGDTQLMKQEAQNFKPVQLSARILKPSPYP